MTVNDVPVGQDGVESPPDESLEWLTDDGWWTLVPVDVSGDDRLTRWISIERDDLRDLEQWR